MTAETGPTSLRERSVSLPTLPIAAVKSKASLGAFYRVDVMRRDPVSDDK